MAPPLSTRRCALLAPALAIACDRAAAPAAPQRRADATTASTTADAAAARAPAPDAGAPRSPLDLFVVGGADLLRPDASVALRVERFAVGDPRVADVTGAATFRVVPEAAGRVEPGGAFRGLAVGRAEVVAAVGADEARTIVEVTTELPAGVAAIPTLQMSDGRAAHSVRFGALPDGTVLLDVQATGLALSLRGRRRGSAFPIEARVEGAAPAAGDAGAGPPPATGTLVLDRWVDRRLDGHAALQVAGRPLRLRFTVLLPDAAPLLRRVGP